MKSFKVLKLAATKELSVSVVQNMVITQAFALREKRKMSNNNNFKKNKTLRKCNRWLKNKY